MESDKDELANYEPVEINVSDDNHIEEESCQSKGVNKLTKQTWRCTPMWWRIIMIVTLGFLVLRLIGITIGSITYVECLQAKTTTAVCVSNSSIIPAREIIEPIIPVPMMSLVLLWFWVLTRLKQKRPSYVKIMKKLPKKVYFWVNTFCLFWVLFYHGSVVVTNWNYPGVWLYIPLGFELTIDTVFMYILNFRRGPTREDRRRLYGVLAVYRAVLLMGAMEEFILSFFGTIYLSQHILTFKYTTKVNNTVRTASNIIFMALNAKYRLMLGLFFMKKCFLKNGNFRILHDKGDNRRIYPEDSDDEIDPEDGINYMSRTRPYTVDIQTDRASRRYVDNVNCIGGNTNYGSRLVTE